MRLPDGTHLILLNVLVNAALGAVLRNLNGRWRVPCSGESL